MVLFLLNGLDPVLQLFCMLSRFSRIYFFVTPVDYNLPSFSVHGILQARRVEWVVRDLNIKKHSHILILSGKNFKSF